MAHIIYPQMQRLTKRIVSWLFDKAELFSAGSNVRLKLTMNNITNSWLPPNGFDHVGFSVFIGLPNEAAQGPSNFSGGDIDEAKIWDDLAVIQLTQ